MKKAKKVMIHISKTQSIRRNLVFIQLLFEAESNQRSATEPKGNLEGIVSDSACQVYNACTVGANLSKRGGQN